MPTYVHECLVCQKEFEQFYSITAPVPPCPECNGESKRLISGGSGKGIVELTGHEMTNKMQKDISDLKREAGRNENVLANLIGEAKYHSNLSAAERRRR